jgi:hypothetical protein
MDITFQPVRVAAGFCDGEGQMVLVDGTLVAVLVRLTASNDNPDAQGQWFVQAGFGPLSETHELFSTLEDAEDWVLHRSLAQRNPGSGRIVVSRHSPHS